MAKDFARGERVSLNPYAFRQHPTWGNDQSRDSDLSFIKPKKEENWLTIREKQRKQTPKTFKPIPPELMPDAIEAHINATIPDPKPVESRWNPDTSDNQKSKAKSPDKEGSSKNNFEQLRIESTSEKLTQPEDNLDKQKDFLTAPREAPAADAALEADADNIADDTLASLPEENISTGTIQQILEAKHGIDLNDVTLNTGSSGAAFADQHQAEAVAHGNQISFNTGEFDPKTLEGQHRIAHEFGHIIQKRKGQAKFESLQFKLSGKKLTAEKLRAKKIRNGRVEELANLNRELALDLTQAGLDVAGFFPGVGAGADIASGVMSAVRGDWIGAGLSMLSAIPFAGDGTAGIAKNARLIKRINNTKNKIRTLRSRLKATEDYIKSLGNTAKSASKGTKNPVKKINGRWPINSDLAGKVFPVDRLPAKLKQKYPKSVFFKKNGFPDFAPYAKQKISLKNGFTGKEKKDFELANKKFGFKSTPIGYTWHHVEDGRTLMLVPKDLHQFVRHTGGMAKTR